LFLEIISLLFEDLDFVPSDIAAGLILLNLKSQAEAERREFLNGARVDPGSHENLNRVTTHEGNLKSHLKLGSRLSSLSVQNEPCNTPRIISHFMKYALGSYVSTLPIQRYNFIHSNQINIIVHSLLLCTLQGWPWFLVAHMKTGLCRLWENILCCGCCV